MSVTECPRTWQAEAAEDRRLSEADRASFERHVATCEVCERAEAELALLRGIGARLPVSTSAPLERRRVRNEVLRRANELTVGLPRALPWRGIAATLAVATLALVLVVRLRPR